MYVEPTDTPKRKPVTVPRLRAMKARGEKIVELTCYGASFAAQMEAAGVDVALVGDSLGMVVQGHGSTLPVTLAKMVYHSSLVARGLSATLQIVDLQFMQFGDPARALAASALGITPAHRPRFSKDFLAGRESARDAFAACADDVHAGVSRSRTDRGLTDADCCRPPRVARRSAGVQEAGSQGRLRADDGQPARRSLLAGRAGPAAGRPRRGERVRQPDTVRPERGFRALSAHAGGGHRRTHRPRLRPAVRAVRRDGLPVGFGACAGRPVPDIGDTLEGECRPGHFDGVATVVAKLLAMVGPDVAMFGAKDWQQLLVVRRLVHELALPVAIVAAPIVREADGTAMASRNRYLDAGQRARGPSATLLVSMRQSFADGHALQAVEGAAIRRLARAGIEPDYAVVRRAADVAVPSVGERAGLMALVAARLGSTRLIGNLAFD